MIEVLRHCDQMVLDVGEIQADVGFRCDGPILRREDKGSDACRRWSARAAPTSLHLVRFG